MDADTMLVCPQVPGQMDEGTVLDHSVVPYAVRHLKVLLDTADGDDLMQLFPLHLVTPRLRDTMLAAGLTGIRFGERVPASLSEDTLDDDTDRPLPELVLMTVVSASDQPDVRVEADWLRLSARAWAVVREVRLRFAEVRPA